MAPSHCSWSDGIHRGGVTNNRSSSSRPYSTQRRCTVSSPKKMQNLVIDIDYLKNQDTIICGIKQSGRTKMNVIYDKVWAYFAIRRAVGEERPKRCESVGASRGVARFAAAAGCARWTRGHLVTSQQRALIKLYGLERWRHWWC